ncbi:MAG: ATP-dependent Clp protease ATP-binding subunit [Patescibacteria group bacterium]
MLTPDILDRFTTHLKEALQKALGFAVASGRELVEPGDLLIGLINEKGSIGAELLLKQGIDIHKAELALRGIPSSQRGKVAAPDLSPAVKKILEKCVLTAHINEHKYVGTEHLLSALLEGEYPDLKTFFDNQKLDLAQLREQVLQVLKSTSRFPELAIGGDEMDDPTPLPPELGRPQMPRQTRITALEAFTRELTNPETAASLDPVIGRERELDRVIEILCRRMKNNPVLLGDPGVGKTAIVEGLAKRLSEGDVPDALHGKKLLVLDLALTVAGTMYRGEFEARLKQILDEVRNDPEVILFIDEIHNIVGAGSTSGSLDAANILKPALSRGEIRCVGATTWAEYKKHIEPDAALERRFQPVAIEEPSAEATLEILKGLEKYYADYHRVKYAKGILENCIYFAEKYFPDRFFPDKAIDLLDESAASVIARRKSSERMERLASLELAVQVAEDNKNQAVHEGNLAKADEASKDMDRLDHEFQVLKKAYDDARSKDRPLVTPQDVAEVVSRVANVPLSTVLATERERLSSLENRLTSQILGQPKAMSAVSDAIFRSRLGLSDPKRPKTALLFVGPSGTGKTETAKVLAQELFGREEALIKLDMSEFSEGHTVAKLVGSPAGYVGYRDGTRLTDALRKRPHSVVLFDEFEKAHPDVQNLLLQILEDGCLTDGTGRPVSFKHSYAIITSNVGSDRLEKKSLGFENNENSDDESFERMIKDELALRFRPELLNRLDRVVVFQPLNRGPIKELLKRELKKILSRVESVQLVACQAGDDVLEWLLSQPLPKEEGARAVRRLVEKEITAAIGRILTEQPQKKKLRIKATSNGLKLS